MATLPIVKMTLYKHGIGFFMRQGPVTGEAVALTFRKEEMNDVLKSLTAVAEGGRVLGVDYDTPEDKAERLARSSVQLSDAASLRDLLRDLRGRTVEVETTSGRAQGVVVGVDLPAEREPMTAALLSLFQAAERTVTPLRLADVVTLTLAEERAASDLGYFLETSLTEEDKRAVTIRFSRGATGLNVGYIAPSPVWRVSYRLVVDDATDAPQGLLQGWGLFDNTLDEDLENVELTFVSGMPVSFIYDLYTPFTPERPTVTEEGRSVAAPVEFAAALPPAAATRGFGLTGAHADTLRPMRAMPKAAELADATVVAATGQVQGEFFSFTVADPVTVRRGRSAMAPLLQAQAEFRKERIYNGRKQPRHPVVTLRFKNDTGLTLERGPVTIIEAGEYGGEAILPFTAPGGELLLAYAVDLGVTIKEEAATSQELYSVTILGGMLSIQEYSIQRVTYTVANRNDRDVKVTVEHPRGHNYTPFDTPAPVETTADADRYAVEAAAQHTTHFTVQQRRLVSRREEIRDQRLEQLQRWLRDHMLEQATHDKLTEILGLYDRIAEHEANLKKNEAVRQDLFAQQKVIQGNLAALKPTGEEGQLRARYARTLQEQEDRLALLKRDDERQRQLIEEKKKEIEEQVRSL